MDNYIFYRWLHNVRGKDPDEIAPQSDWETPFFARIKGKDKPVYGKHIRKAYELTQPGKNFIAIYQQQQEQQSKSGVSKPICRSENVRFKASVYKMPSIPVDWHKVEMNNWNQYTTEVGSVKVKLNDGDNPTVEFLPAPIEGNNPLNLYFRLFSDCTEVAKHLEQMLDMQIGRLELSSKGEWVVYSPLAKVITDKIGLVNVEGVGKINASLPNRYGEFEFYDPRDAAEFLEMPRRLV